MEIFAGVFFFFNFASIELLFDGLVGLSFIAFLMMTAVVVVVVVYN